MNYKTYDGTLYDYSAGVYCGVLVKDRVMRKLAALQAKHLEDVRRVLSDAADKGEAFPSFWTLHYPDGKQTEVRFIESGESITRRIKAATTANPPIARKLVFIADSMDEAKVAADARHASMKEVV